MNFSNRSPPAQCKDAQWPRLHACMQQPVALRFLCCLQDNEPLMRALGKLIQLNNPDLILFVGEALVGNDAVDQLKKFNQALVDTTGHVRLP